MIPHLGARCALAARIGANGEFEQCYRIGSNRLQLSILRAAQTKRINGQGAHVRIKKVIIDGETIDHRYVPASYVDILDCFGAGLVPI